MKRVFLAGAALLLSASALADECDKATTQLELNTGEAVRRKRLAAAV